MKNSLLVFLVFICCVAFSQKKLEISNKSKYKIYTPYIANDGSCAVSESYSGRQSIRTFDKEGNFLSEINFKGSIDIFDPKNKCWISSIQGNKKLEVIQIDFDGKITETEVAYRRSYLKERVIINSEGNVEFYFAEELGMMPYICVEYNPENKSSRVQDFSEIEIQKTGSIVVTRFLGRLEDETFFVNWNVNAFSGKAEVFIYAVNKKNQLRQVGNLDFNSKNGKELFRGPLFIAPYLGDFNDHPIVFAVVFHTYEENGSRLGINKDPKSTYKLYKIEENNTFSMLDFDPSRFPDLNGEFSIFLHSNESEKTLLTFVEKNYSAVVFATNFDEPLDGLKPEVFDSLNVPELIFRENEYSELYQMAANCKKGIFRIGDDGIGRLIFIQDNKAFFGAK